MGMICKLQIDMTEKNYLIYNKDRTVMFEGCLDDDIRTIMKGDKQNELNHKAYFKCSIINSKIIIGQRIRNRRW